MAGKIDLKEFNDVIQKTEKGLTDVIKTLNTTIERIIVLEKETKKGATTQSEANKKTKELDEIQKQRERTTRQIASTLDKLNKETGELTDKEKELIKARVKVKEATKKAREEAEKQLGVTKQQTSFTDKLTKAYQNAALKIAAVVIAVKAIIGAVSNYVKLIKEVNKQNTQTAQTFNLTRTEAKDLTKEIRLLTAAYGEEFNDVLRSANVLSKEFGITGRDALDLINQGFEKGADVNGEFLELLKEYPAQLKSVGFTAEQTIAIITQTERAGVFSDKGIDAIKEAGLRLREMTPAAKTALDAIGLSSKQISKDLESGTKTLFQVTQEVSKKLSELPPQSKEVGQAIADIFGGPGEDAGLRFLTTLKDIKLDLKGVTSNLTELEQSQINVNKAYEEFRTSIINGSGPITNVFTSINNSISNILELLRKFNLSDEDLFGEEGAKSAREEYAKNIEFIKSYRSELRKSGQTEEEFTKLVLEYEIKKNNEYINELQNKKELQKSDFKLLGYAKEENKLLENSLKGITDKDQLLAASKAKELEDAKKLAAEKEKIRQDELKAEREAAAEKIRLSDEVFQKIVEDNDNQKVLNYLEAEEEKLYQEQSKELRKEGYDIEKEFRERERKDIEEQTQFNLDQQDLILEKKKEAKDLSIDILNQLGDFSNELANRQIQDVEDRVKKGVITEEKGAKEIAKLKRKQAITDKALGIFNAFISTSEAVANALKIKLPPPIPLIFAGLYGTLGAAQIATIAARPIPKFKTGTRSPLLEPTLAYVGDGGRSEVVRTKEGKEWFTPATSTLAVLPRGSEVLPDAEKYKREKQSVIVNNISTKDDKPNINTLLTSSGLHRWYSDSKGSKQFNDTYFRR